MVVNYSAVCSKYITCSFIALALVFIVLSMWPNSVKDLELDKGLQVQLHALLLVTKSQFT